MKVLNRNQVQHSTVFSSAVIKSEKVTSSQVGSLILKIGSSRVTDLENRVKSGQVSSRVGPSLLDQVNLFR